MTKAKAGMAASRHIPSLVSAKIRVAKVSQPMGRIIKVIGISFITSTNTKSIAVHTPVRIIGKCTRVHKRQPE